LRKHREIDRYVTEIRWNILESGHPNRPFRGVEDVGSPVAAEGKKPTGSISTAPSEHGHNFVGGYLRYRSPFFDDHRSYFCLRIEDRPDNSLGETMATVHDAKGEDWPEDT
jgi:hypothetical protein